MKKCFLLFMTVLLILACSSCVQYIPEEESGEADSSEKGDHSAELSSPQKEKKDSITLAVLGDSIARGYGLEEPTEQRWSRVLAELLEQDFVVVTETNHGVDGLTGKGLEKQLSEGLAQELADCDAVLISIGGNNVLSFLGEITDEVLQDGEFPTEMFEDFFRYAYASEGQDVSDCAYAVDEMNQLVDRVNSIFESEDFKKRVAEAGEKLKEEIPAVVSLIRRSNPNARIVLQTVYNPYQGMQLSFRYLKNPVALSLHGNTAVSALNEAIFDCAEQCGYQVADVYAAFAARSETLSNAGVDLQKKALDLDPHPNKKGHRVIAELYYQLLTED